MQTGTLTVTDAMEWVSQIHVNGVPREHVSWSVDREITNDLPEQVSGGGGVAQATGTVTWAGQDVQSRPTSPWSPSSGWMPRRGDKVQIFAGTTGNMFSQFVGIIDQTTGTVGDSLESKIVDRIDDFSTVVDIPAMASLMPALQEDATQPRRVGLSNLYHSVYCLRAAGFHTVPGPEYRVCLDVPMQGSMWPHKGQVLTCTSKDNPNTQGGSYSAPWGTSRSNTVATYTPSPNRDASEPVQIMMLLAPGHAGTAFVRCNYAGGQTVALRVIGNTVQLRINAVNVATCPFNQATIVEGLIWGSTAEVRTNLGATGTGTGGLTGTATLNTVDLDIDAASRVGSFQVSHPSREQDRFASIGFTPSAVIDLGDLHTGQSAIPAQDQKPARDILDEMSQAILRPFWIDETGVARMVGSDSLYKGSPVKTLTTLNDIVNLSWEDDILAVRKEIHGTYMLPSVNRRSRSSLTVWEGSESIVLKNGESQDIIVEQPGDEDWILVDETVRYFTDTTRFAINQGIGTWFAATYTDGENEVLSTPWNPDNDYLDVTWEKLGANRYKITLSVKKTMAAGYQLEIRSYSSDNAPANTRLWPMWWDTTMPIIRARARVKWTTEDLTPVQTGATVGSTLEHDFGPWATGYNPDDRTDAIDDIVAFLTDQVKEPHPRISGLGVVYDPRLQLGDVVTVSSLTLLGVTLRCLIIGVSTQAGTDGISQSLTVRIISAQGNLETYDEFETKPEISYTQWEALTALTYTDFNTNGE